MKRLIWIAFSVGLAMLVSNCFIDIDDDGPFGGCIRGSGPIVSQEFLLPPVEGIVLSMPGNVFITQGPEQEIIVEGEGNILDEIELDVRNGIWEIETRRCVRDVDDLRVFVTIPYVEELSIIGSGNIVSENLLDVEDLYLSIPGSGTIDLAVDADDIDAAISGSGDIVLEGIADDVDLNIPGSGSYRAYGLDAETADVRISGSGNAWVRVRDFLKVRISGSGTVRYRGFPEVDVSISGSGRVVDDN